MHSASGAVMSVSDDEVVSESSSDELQEEATLRRTGDMGRTASNRNTVWEPTDDGNNAVQLVQEDTDVGGAQRAGLEVSSRASGLINLGLWTSFCGQHGY